LAISLLFLLGTVSTPCLLKQLAHADHMMTAKGKIGSQHPAGTACMMLHAAICKDRLG
jgi:hypothetical protein